MRRLQPLLVFTLLLPNFVLSNKTWTVYYPHQFSKNELCSAMACSSDELCLVSGSNAICIHKLKLHDVEGIHVNYGTGKQIEHNAEEVEHFKAVHKRIHHRHFHQPRHFEHNEKINNECDAKELHKIGGRLLLWFAQEHKAAKTNNELPLHKHSRVCREDVAWMFQQWDGDNDGELSLKELAPLEADTKEKCLKAFIDRCDTEAGNDNAITLDEWCDCFAWADNERHEPPCHALLHEKDPHVLGAYHPRCTLEGYFKTEQCHENECWCVDKYGREFDKSRITGQLPDCGQYASEMDAEEERELASEL